MSLVKYNKHKPFRPQQFVCLPPCPPPNTTHIPLANPIHPSNPDSLAPSYPYSLFSLASPWGHPGGHQEIDELLNFNIISFTKLTQLENVE